MGWKSLPCQREALKCNRPMRGCAWGGSLGGRSGRGVGAFQLLAVRRLVVQFLGQGRVNALNALEGNALPIAEIFLGNLKTLADIYLSKKNDLEKELHS